MRHGALPDTTQVLVRVGAPQRLGLLDGEPGRDVAVERVVGARLVGHHVDLDAAPHDLGHQLGRVAEQADRERRAAPARAASRRRERVVEVGGALVEVAGLEPPLDAAQVDLEAQRAAAVHRDGQRLGAAHAAEPRGEHEASRQRAAEVLARGGGEGLVGALHDALAPDVDPGAGRHLAVHHEPGAGRARGSAPRWPTWARGSSWRSARAARARASRTRRPACPTARAASRRRRAPGARAGAPRSSARLRAALPIPP